MATLPKNNSFLLLLGQCLFKSKEFVTDYYVFRNRCGCHYCSELSSIFFSLLFSLFFFFMIHMPCVDFNYFRFLRNLEVVNNQFFEVLRNDFAAPKTFLHSLIGRINWSLLRIKCYSSKSLLNQTRELLDKERVFVWSFQLWKLQIDCFFKGFSFLSGEDFF